MDVATAAVIEKRIKNLMRASQSLRAQHTEARIEARELPCDHPVALANPGLREELLSVEDGTAHPERGLFAKRVSHACLPVQM